MTRHNLNRPHTLRSIKYILTMAFVAVVFMTMRPAAAAPDATLQLVNVGAPAINCVFDADCTITVTDSTASVAIPSSTGEGVLQTREFPVGETGTQAEGLYAYLYRIDLRNVSPNSGTAPCVWTFTIDLGELEALDYDGNTGVEDVFVITSGGLGSVAPVSAVQDAGVVTFNFGAGICPGSSSYFFGVTSDHPSQPVQANLFGWNDGPTLNLDLAARAPQEVGEFLTLSPTLDTWVNETPGAVTPSPFSQFLLVGGDELTYQSYSLLQFDTSQLPLGSEILSAELDLWHDNSASTTTLSHNICAKAVTSAWNASVDASSAPSISNTCISNTTVSNDWGTHTWNNLDSLVQQWVDNSNANNGLALQQQQYSYGYKGLQSADGNVAPELRIRYLAPSEADGAVASLIANSQEPPQITYDGELPQHVALKVPVDTSFSNPVAQAQAFLASYNDLYQLPDPFNGLYLDRIAKLDDSSRASAESHLFFKQRINGIPVIGASVGVHIEDGNVTSTQGRYLQDAPQFPTPALSAFDIETNFAEQWASKGYVVTGETRLVLINWSLFGDADDTTYQVWEVRAVGPDFSGSVYYDSMTGIERRFLSDTHEGRAGEDFAITDHSGRGRSNCNTGTLWFDEDGAVSFPGPGGDSSDDGSTANITLHETYHYFYDTFGRLSWNDRGEQIPVRIDAADADRNAYFIASCSHLAFGENMVTLDIMAHEFTHGLDERTAQLAYINQSGALDESFADVFGILIDDDDWTVGEGSTIGAIRDISNPPAFEHPDHMDNFLETTADAGGVHTNSGIPNKVAYLLIEGDTHSGVDVAALGRSKVAQLYYDVLTTRLTSSAQFIDARNAMIDQALSNADKGRFGFTSADVCAVRDAWASVGVGDITEMRCSASAESDTDGDGVPDRSDNCVTVANAGQRDSDRDLVGDVCDSDNDDDGVPDATDNCPSVHNPDQADRDFDGHGDVCDDSDNDRVTDDTDNCYLSYNPDQANSDDDEFGDACDTDDDNDGRSDWIDNCQFTPNPGQADADGDGIGDDCDNCDSDSNSNQIDNDGDGIGDICDPDDDNDDVLDNDDNCQYNANPDQIDIDSNGTGSLCDADEALTLWEVPQHFDLLFGSGGGPIRLPIPSPNCLSCANDWYLTKPDHVIQVDLPAELEVRVVDNFGRIQTHAGAGGDINFALPIDPEAGFDSPFFQRGSSNTVNDLQYYIEIVAPDGYDTSEEISVDVQINQSVPTAVSLSNASSNRASSAATLIIALLMLSTATLVKTTKQ